MRTFEQLIELSASDAQLINKSDICLDLIAIEQSNEKKDNKQKSWGG